MQKGLALLVLDFLYETKYKSKYICYCFYIRLIVVTLNYHHKQNNTGFFQCFICCILETLVG